MIHILQNQRVESREKQGNHVPNGTRRKRTAALHLLFFFLRLCVVLFPPMMLIWNILLGFDCIFHIFVVFLIFFLDGCLVLLVKLGPRWR